MFFCRMPLLMLTCRSLIVAWGLLWGACLIGAPLLASEPATAEAA